uniref:receptor protein-tyrosine kinase n=1 Tax=Plectus sambesii TaxID=2011161 RepID=A0A914W8G1_9BILA
MHIIWGLLLLATATNGFKLDTLMNEREFDKLVRLGQCAVLCTKKLIHRTERKLRSGRTVPFFNLSSSDAYKQCEFGCKSPYSFEQSHGFPAAFQQGQQFRDQSLNLGGNTSSPIASVALKCMNVPEANSMNAQSPPSVMGLVVFELKETLTTPMRYLVEGRLRVVDPRTNQYEEHFWGSALKDRPLLWVTEMVPTVEYRFLVTAIDENGRLGETVGSEYMSALPHSHRLESPVSVSVSRQFVVDGRLSAELAWSHGDRPAGQGSCFYHLAWFNPAQPQQSAIFSLDESDGFLLSNLHYEQNYTIYLSSISTVARNSRIESEPVGTVLVAKSCRELNGPFYSTCGLGRISDLHLASLNEEVGSALVSWVPADNETDLEGYIVYYRSLPNPGEDECPVVLDEHEVKLNGSARSVRLELESAGCQYVVQIASFDAEQRWSPSAELLIVYPSRSSSGYSPFLLWIIAPLLMTITAVALFVGCWRWNAALFTKLGNLQSLFTKFTRDADISRANPPLPFYTPTVSTPAPNNRLAVNTRLQARDLHGTRLSFDSSDSSPIGQLSFSRASVDSPSADVGLDSTMIAAPSSKSGELVFSAEDLPKRTAIGKGQFGNVWLAYSTVLRRDVALKEFIRGASNEQCHQLEIDALTALARSHCKYIIRMFGVYQSQPDVVAGVVFEYCSGGNLKEYLREVNRILPFETATRRRDSGIESPSCCPAEFVFNGAWKPLVFARKLVAFARQICIAMEYLSAHQYVHRDLAARNVLLFEKESNPLAPFTTQTIKLADFGMARLMTNADYRPQHSLVLPMKWMPPETLDNNRGIFLPKSDVWSFGALLSEMVTLGDDPPPEIAANSNRDDGIGHVLETISCRRPSLDVHLAAVLCPIMAKCWRLNEAERPSFAELLSEFDVIRQ